MDHQQRIARVRAGMAHRGIDAMIFGPSSDLFYLSGIREKLSERIVCAVLTQRAFHFLLPAFELGNLSEESCSLLKVHGWTDGQDPFAMIYEMLPQGGADVALGRHMPSWMSLPLFQRFPLNRWLLADEIMRGIRSVKSAEEYRLLKLTQERSCRAFTRLLEQGLCGKTELEIMRLFMELSAQEGVDSAGPLVASGPHTALPHHTAGNRVVQPGDVLFMDFGGTERKSLYRGDTTRTVAVKRIPAQMQEIYDIVLEANHAAFRAALPGTPCSQVDKAGRSVIEKAGYGEFFTHRLGHGLGLDVHEPPFLGPSSKEVLAVGNVVSNEPGIYLPGRFGIRTEDILYIREDGPERLTPLGHELMVVD